MTKTLWHARCIRNGMNLLTSKNIRVLANHLYVIEGRPMGRAKEHWHIAEQQLTENLFRDTPSSDNGKSDAKSHCRP